MADNIWMNEDFSEIIRSAKAVEEKRPLFPYLLVVSRHL